MGEIIALLCFIGTLITVSIGWKIFFSIIVVGYFFDRMSYTLKW